MKHFLPLIILILFSIQLWSNELEIKLDSIDSLFIFKKGKIQGDSPFLYFSGKMLQQNREYYESIAYFEEYLCKNPEDSLSLYALFNIADSYLMLDYTDMAFTIFSELNDRFPFSKLGILSLKKMGDIYFSREDYSKAKLLYQNFVYHNFDLDIKDYAFFQIERCNYYLGITKHPTEIFQNFIKKYPRSKLCPELRFELGNYYFKIRKYAESINEYNKIVDINPEVSWLDSVYFQLALIYHEQKDWKNTIKNINNLTQNFPESNFKKKAYKLLIDGLLAENNFLLAINTLNSTIQSTRHDERNEYYQMLADIYEKFGLYNEVMDIYQIMLQNENDEEKKEMLHNRISELRKKTGKIEDSLHYFNNKQMKSN
ncbi:MAG: tetratricopeptide repeat protein [Candidatus Cloacimonadota bacterium]|nr:tetratricopeptide repeat protein [Candidatus Cloacimonadota bacterium]